MSFQSFMFIVDNPLTGREWDTANSPRPKKARMSKSKIKSMLICFFLTVRISSTRNLCHQDKLSIKLFIRKSLEDSGKGWHVCDQHCTHLDAVPRQRPKSHGSLHHWIFGRKKHSCGSSAPLFALSQSLWLLFIPRLKNHLKGCHFGTLDNIQTP